MMKAFALKDFNSEKILQRNFFKNLRAELSLSDELTDQQILDSFSELKESNLKMLATIKIEIERYLLQRLYPHRWRINQLILAISHEFVRQRDDDKDSDLRDLQDKLDNADKFYDRYGEIINLVDKVNSRFDIVWALISAKITENYRQIFSARLKQARKDMNLTQQQLAELAGIPKITLTQYEQKKREPGFFTVIKLAKALNKSTDYFIK